MRKITNLIEFREALRENLPLINSWTRGKRRGVLAGCISRLLNDGVAAGKIDDVLIEFNIIKGRRHIKQYVSHGLAKNEDEFAFERAIGRDVCENKTEYKEDGKRETEIKILGPKTTLAELEMPKTEDNFRIPQPKAAMTLEEVRKIDAVKKEEEKHGQINTKYTAIYDAIKNRMAKS